MRTNRVLVIEPAQSYERLQGAKEFFVENLDEFLHQQHRAILEDLMRYERECFLNAHPYQRHDGRVDQANGFYQRHLTTRSGTFELQVPRTRSGLFHSQVIPRGGIKQWMRLLSQSFCWAFPRARPVGPWLPFWMKR